MVISILSCWQYLLIDSPKWLCLKLLHEVGDVVGKGARSGDLSNCIKNCALLEERCGVETSMDKNTVNPELNEVEGVTIEISLKSWMHL